MKRSLTFGVVLAATVAVPGVGGAEGPGDQLDPVHPVPVVVGAGSANPPSGGPPPEARPQPDASSLREASPVAMPFIEVELQVEAIVADPVRDVFYASVRATDTNHPNRIVTLDRWSGRVLRSVVVGDRPNELAIAPDGSALYVGVDGDGDLLELRLPSMTPGWRHDFGLGSQGVITAMDIAVIPDDPGLVVVSTGQLNGYNPHSVIAIRDGARLPDFVDAEHGTTLAFGPAPGQLFTLKRGSEKYEIAELGVDDVGVRLVNERVEFQGKTFPLEYGGDGRLYTASGAIHDATVWPPAIVESVEPPVEADVFLAQSLAVESAARRATFVVHVGGELEFYVAVFDLDTGELLERWSLPDRFVERSHHLTVLSEDDGILGSTSPDDGNLLLFYPGSLRGTNGEFTAVTQARVLDTRTGIGTGGVIAPIGARSSIEVQITGRGGIPTTGVKAIVMNATAVDPTDGTFLSVFPTGISRPDISNLNTVTGRNRANLVTVRVGADGKVRVYNFGGSTHVLFDVAGYYQDHDGSGGSRYRAVAPVRVADNRHGTGGVGVGKLGPKQTMTIDVTGRFGVPAVGTTAVVLNVTSSQSTADSFMTVSPGDVRRPNASNLNFRAGEDTANQVFVRVPPDGMIDIYNDAGETFVIVDLLGYFGDGGDPRAGRFLVSNPFRLTDTRWSSPFPDDGRLWEGDILFTGFDEDTMSAYSLNVTVTETSSGGFVTAYPYPGSPPRTSTVNYGPGDTVANHAIVGTGPYMGFLNENGRTHLILDVFGAFS